MASADSPPPRAGARSAGSSPRPSRCGGRSPRRCAAARPDCGRCRGRSDRPRCVRRRARRARARRPPSARRQRDVVAVDERVLAQFPQDRGLDERVRQLGAVGRRAGSTSRSSRSGCARASASRRGRHAESARDRHDLPGADMRRGELAHDCSSLRATADTGKIRVLSQIATKDDRAGDDLGEERRNVHQDQPVADHGDGQRPEGGAEDVCRGRPSARCRRAPRRRSPAARSRRRRSTSPSRGGRRSSARPAPRRARDGVDRGDDPGAPACRPGAPPRGSSRRPRPGGRTWSSRGPRAERHHRDRDQRRGSECRGTSRVRSRRSPGVAAPGSNSPRSATARHRAGSRGPPA